MTFQQQVFAKIITQFENPSLAYKAIGEVLHIDISNVYRRVNDQITLKLEELELLVQHFKITLDDILYADREMFALHSSGDTNEPNFDKLLDPNQFAPFKPFKDIIGYYWGSGIQLDHFCTHPEIFYFVVNATRRLSWHQKEHYFSLQSIDDTFRKKVETYYEATNRFNTVDFFHKLSLNIALGHVIYVYETGATSSKDCLTILDCIQEALHLLEQKIAVGDKLGDGKYSFEAYYTDQPQIGHFNLLISQHFSLIGNSYVAPEYLSSYNPVLIQEALDYYEKLKSSSVKISQGGEKTRRKLFRHYQDQIRHTKRLIR